MATSESSVHAFMEMAAGLLLADRLDGSMRDELLRIAAHNGMHEEEMDEVVLQLADQGIVSLDESYNAAHAERDVAGGEQSEEEVEDDEGGIPEEAEKEESPPLESKDPLARDMFKQRVIAQLRSNRELAAADCRQLLTEARGFGVEDEAAVVMLRRWLVAANLDTEALLPAAPPQSIEHAPPIPRPTSTDSPPPIPPPLPSALMPAGEPEAPPLASATEEEIAFVDGDVADEPEGIHFVETEHASDDAAGAANVDEPCAPAPVTPMAPPVSAPPPVNAPRSDCDQRKPGESYIRYLRKAIAQLGREHISVRSEQRLISQGVEKLGIGEPYALELLRQIADELRIPMLSRQSIEEDPRFDEFRERAASILAEHRGVNVKSRMLLSAIGQEIGLGEDELDQAMSQLSGAGGTELDDEKKKSFRARLQETMRSMRDSFITSPIETAILDDGVDYEGLSYDVAKQILHEVAEQAGVIVIDKRQAKRHIEGLLSQNVTQGAPPVDLAPLLEEARLWGLSDDEFMEIVATQRAEKSKQQRREKRITTIALAGSCLTAAVVLWGAIYLMWPREKVESAQAEEPPATPAPANVSSEPPKEASSWSDPELLISLTNARKATPLERQAVVQGAVSEDPERRMLSIKALVGDLPSDADDRARRDVLIELFKHWFRVETVDENAQQLMLELLALLPDVGDQLPQEVEAYEYDFQLLSAIVDVLSQESLSSERRKWLNSKLADELETVVDLTRGWTEVERHCKAELAVLLYRNLITAVKTTDGPFEPHHWALSVHLVALVRPVDPARAEKLQLDFLDANMRSGKESWTPYEELIRRFAYSKDPVTVMRMSKLMEETSNESLQKLLSTLLLLNIGEVSKSQSVSEVAALVRSHFQGTEKPPTSEQVTHFVKVGEAYVSRYSAATGTDAIAQQLVDLARMNTLGSAAHAGAAGAEKFDALLGQERRLGISTNTSAPSQSALAWQRGLNDTLAKQIQLLDREKRVNKRVVTFQVICNAARSARRRPAGTPAYQPEPKYAQMLAKYMVSPKTASEHEHLLMHCALLVNWPNVLLALVDELEKFDSREAQVEDVARTLAPGITIGPNDPWNRVIQRELLQVALDHLQTTTTTGSRSRSTVTLAGNHLSTYYQTQALLRGVTEQQVAGADGPGRLLRLLVVRLHKQLLAADIRSPEDKQWVEEFEHTITATENAAVNDLQRLAMFQRLWLRLLRIELTLEAPVAAQRALDIEDTLLSMERNASTIWEQLRDGELQLLKLWLLYNQEVGS